MIPRCEAALERGGSEHSERRKGKDARAARPAACRIGSSRLGKSLSAAIGFSSSELMHHDAVRPDLDTEKENTGGFR